jgi:hypothetical protein
MEIHMGRVRPGEYRRSNTLETIVFTIELDKAVSPRDLPDVLAELEKVRAGITQRLIPLAFNRNPDSAPSATVIFPWSLTDNELRSAIRVVISRLTRLGHINATPIPVIPTKIRSTRTR